MKERPILFSGAMVRAILDGRKTQTRRVAKEFDGLDVDKVLARFPHQRGCPYGEPGDRLWVRETFSRLEAFDFFHADVPEDVPGFWYWADGNPTWGDWSRPKPSIHMPREACRIQLEVTDVRVERLNDCSEADAIAEGIAPELDGWTDYSNPSCQMFISPVDSYRTLWDSINGAGAWDANPWVWVVEFRRIHA
ncbi:hypothetical protein [Cupriavidus nantongensis]|uniref:hypothetical protein n=1 Tax=Cupriavidus nantongensis TaxID=1796606 RepID=UPI00358F521A